MTVHEVAFFNRLQLLLLGVNEDHVRIAALTDLDRCARSDRDHVDLDSRFFLEQGKQIVEQPGILRARGGRHFDARLGKGRGCTADDCKSENQYE